MKIVDTRLAIYKVVHVIRTQLRRGRVRVGRDGLAARGSGGAHGPELRECGVHGARVAVVHAVPGALEPQPRAA